MTNKEEARREHTRNGDKLEDPISQELVAGMLSIYVVSNAENWHGGVDEGDRYLRTFTGPDWKSIYFDVLNCPRWHEYTGEGTFQEHCECQRMQFQTSIPEFPMLGRIYSLLEDVGYTPADVKRLRDECQTLQERTTDQRAMVSLRKLILACDEALRVGRGLYFVSD